MSKTYCFDFDGVIHPYTKGWHDGSIYNELDADVLKFMTELMKKGHKVFICSVRSKYQIKRYFDNLNYCCCWGLWYFKYQIVPFWKWGWFKKNVVGITNRKLAADYYIDDRAVRYNGDLKKLIKVLGALK